MHKNSAVKKIDTLAFSLALFLLFYIFYISFFKKTVYCLALSALSLLVSHLFYRILTKNKREKEKIKRSDEKIYNRIFLNLPFYCEKDLNAYFSKLFEAEGYSCQISNDKITVTKKGVKRAVYMCFSDKGATESDVFKCERLRKQTGSDGFILLCENSSEEVYKIADILKNKNNAVLSGKQLFDAMKKHNLYPETQYEIKIKKRVLKDIFIYAFSRQRFKSYFLLAVIMFLFSYISPYKTYYLSFAALLFLFCVFSLINKKYNVKTKSEKIFE